MNKKTALFSLYIIGFLFALRSALPTYINSSFLSSLISERNVGFIFAIDSVLAIILFLLLPRILRKIGNYKLAICLVMINILALLGLSLFSDPFLLLIFFIISLVSSTFIGFCLDIFVERNTDDRTTGRTRSFFLTSLNLAWLFAPAIAGLFVESASYQKVYLIASAIMLPVLFMMIGNLRKFEDDEYKPFSLATTLDHLRNNKNLSSIISVGFLLSFFYSWMIMYIPIYLNKYIGFDWKEIGLMFSIMLIPFVLVEIPLGKLADQKWGEKEMLSIGFVIMAISTGIISFIDTKSFVVWAFILFMTRVGASMVEIMSETYFFKKIDSCNANIIGTYRMMSPLAYIIGPLLATLFLYYSFDIKYLFVILGLIMFVGLRYSLRIKDTK